MDDYDPNKVYFKCSTCDFLFMEEPDRFVITCPQCGSEDVFRT